MLVDCVGVSPGYDCYVLHLRLVPVAFSILLALSACGGGSGDGDAGNDCVGGPDYDISGTYTELYSCAEDGVCIETNIPSTIVITAISVVNGQYSFSAEGGWSGTGLICGNVFIWNASTDMYTESGVWTFSDARNFIKTSDYEYRDNSGGGTCIGTASQDGDPPDPNPALLDCVPPEV